MISCRTPRSASFLLSMSCAFALATVHSCAFAAPFAYVSNQSSATVSVIDTHTDEVVRTLKGEGKLGKVNGAVADSGDKTLFVVDAAGAKVNAVDIATDKIRKAIPVGRGPEGIGMSPNGDVAAACIEDDNSVTLIDTKTLEVRKHIATKGKNPEHCEFSSDGRWLLTSNENSNDIDVIDLKTDTSLGTVKSSGHPRGIAFLPHKDIAYVAAEEANSVDVLDVTNRKIVSTIPTALRSAGAIASHDGKFVYIANGGAGSISIIDVAANKAITEIPVGKRPWNMALTRDGTKLYVANGRSNSVSVIDTAAKKVIKEIPVGELPWGVTIP